MSPWANYTFRVIAWNKIGQSQPSSHSKVCSTQPDVPYKNPDNVEGKGTDPSNMVISWTVRTAAWITTLLWCMVKLVIFFLIVFTNQSAVLVIFFRVSFHSLCLKLSTTHRSSSTEFLGRETYLVNRGLLNQSTTGNNPHTLWTTWKPSRNSSSKLWLSTKKENPTWPLKRSLGIRAKTVRNLLSY